VNWLPWSVLKIKGPTVSRQRLFHRFDKRNRRPSYWINATTGNALWAAQVATMKQMDRSAASAKVDEGYQAVREDYLRQRDYRCRELTASIRQQ